MPGLTFHFHPPNFHWGLTALMSSGPIVATIVALRQHSWLTFAYGVIWLILYRFTVYTAGLRTSFLTIKKAVAALISLSRDNKA